MAKGRCKGEGAGGVECPPSYAHHAAETHFLIKNFDTENHHYNACLIKCYVHEIEGSIERIVLIGQNQKNPTFGLDPSTDNFLPQKSTDCG